MGLNPDTFYNSLLYSSPNVPHDNPALLKDFLHWVCADSEDLGSLLEGRIDDIAYAPESDERNVILNTIFDVVRSTPSLVRHQEHYCKQYGLSCATDFIAQVASCASRRVVFIAEIPYFQVVRESIALRGKGYSTFLIYADTPDSRLSELHKESFDASVALPRSLFAFAGVMEAIDAPLIHLQVSMFELDFPISRFAAEHKGAAKCVSEFYDILSLWCEFDELNKVFPELSDYSFASERAVVRDSDAFTCRFPPQAIDDLSKFHGTNKEIIEFHPYPLPEFSAPSSDKYSRSDGLIRIVYAGRVVKLEPDGSFEWPQLRIGGYLYDTFRRITAQNMALDFFMDPNFDIRHREGYELYQEMAMLDDLFSLQLGVWPDKFPEAISHYDFGLNMIAVDKSKLRNRKTQFLALGTKIFTYLEAGLPVIVNREWSHAASIIEENGLGIPIYSDELDRLHEIIANFDYSQSYENIQKFNKDNNLHKRIETLTGLYERLIPEWATAD